MSKNKLKLSAEINAVLALVYDCFLKFFDKGYTYTDGDKPLMHHSDLFELNLRNLMSSYE